jgi:hypothetical protein
VTKVDVRRPVSLDAGPPLFLLPVALVVVLFGVAVLFALVAPGKVTGGVFQVTTPRFVIPAEALTCARTGDDATCTTPVGERVLTIDIHYFGVHAAEPSTCAARLGDGSVPCASRMGDYGHGSHSVWIKDDLGLSSAHVAELRDAVPWWRMRSERDAVLLALIGTLGAAAGVTAFLLRRRARLVPPDRRVPVIAGTVLLSPVLFAATGLLFSLPEGIEQSPLFAVSPFSMLAALMLVGWQWQLAGGRGGRVVSAITATVVVTCYTGMAMLVFLLQSGFED